MARPIEPIPEIDTQEDYTDFLENMKKPAVKRKLNFLRKMKKFMLMHDSLISSPNKLI